MTLGERLRKTRLERGLSQAQVAGTQITRNMLSQLENDLASPSVKTLEYLAETLQVSVGWLLGETDETYEAAKILFRRQDWEGAVMLLQDLPLSEEGQLLLALSALNWSQHLLGCGNVTCAKAAAELALQQQGLLIPQLLQYRAQLLLCRCAMLLGEAMDAALQKLDEICAAESEPVHLLKARYLLNNQQTVDAARELQAVPAAGEALLLRARLLMQGGDTDAALQLLQQAETEGLSEQPLQMELYALLENCYRLREDYRSAYRYASLQLRTKQ